MQTGEDDADGSSFPEPSVQPSVSYFDQCATLLADTAFNRLLERFAAGDEEREQPWVIMCKKIPMIRGSKSWGIG
jgi:hypothetical protein